jgi:outer membrane protein insertion porin family
VSDVKLDGNYLNRDNEFKTLVTIKPGEPYNSEQVAQTTKAFSDYFGSFGYAFAQVQAKPDIDRTNNRVSLTLQADPSRRAYVRKINIAGNVRTRDEIIRREFRQFEASWYDGDKIKLSRDRVDRLGYFKEVNVETVDVPGSSDQIDVLVTVAEKPTGNLQIGAGFSSSEKFTFQFKIAQENVFGSGNYLGIDLNTSKSNRSLSVNSTNPYFTADGVSRTFEAFYRSTKPLNDQGGDYQLITTGGSTRFGVPFTEADTVFFGLGVENTKIRAGTNIPAAYVAYANQFGSSSTSFPLTVGWARDSRDSALAPNQGMYQRVNGEWGIAGDARYLRASYQNQYYYPVTRKITLALNGELGWGKGLADRSFPVFKNFYTGGLGSVRGFEQGSLGPRDVTGSYIGGAKKAVVNAELLVPFPGAGSDRTLRLFGFVDAGNAYSEFEKYDFGTLRASAGAGISWISPIGPLKLAYARPIRKFPGDRIQPVQFQIGTSF